MALISLTTFLHLARLLYVRPETSGPYYVYIYVVTRQRVNWSPRELAVVLNTKVTLPGTFILLKILIFCKINHVAEIAQLCLWSFVTRLVEFQAW